MATIINDRTKKNVREFNKELDAIRKKIASNNCSLGDYKELEKYLIVGDFSQSEIDQLFKQCNFSSWEDFHDKRTSVFGYHEPYDIECVIAKIDGIVDGVLFSLYHAVA